MRRRLPAYGSGIVALLALHTSLIIASQSIYGFETSLNTIDVSSPSTLDANIPSQDLAFEADVLNAVTGGPIANLPKPVQGPLLRPVTKPEVTAPAERKAKSAPFTKWVAPKAATESEAPEAGLSEDTFTVEDSPKTAEEPELAEPEIAEDSEVSEPEDYEPELSEPQLARRARPLLAAPKQPESAQVAPLPKRRAAASNEAPQAPVKEPVAAKKRSSTPSVEFPLTPPTARTDLPPLTKSQLQLRTKVRRVLTHYYNRPLNTRDRSPWEMMHAMLAYEVHSKVLQGGPNGKPITAVGWLCFNQTCKKRSLMYVKDNGQLQVRVGPALQGHRGQLLAMLAQSKVKSDYPMRVDDQDFTINDLIEMEKRTCYPRTELTFKLIGLSHYLTDDATWMNDQGMQWNIPKLISEEIRQPVRGAACGGTHRLSGLTLAYKNRVKRGGPVDGQYLKAKQFVTKYQQYAYRLQNRDGSFSTEWFRGPGNENSIDRKLKTTGHILEWLLYAASEKELHHWKTAKAANYLASIMYNNRYKDWETGPLGHAVHALLLYDRLVFGPYDKIDHLQVNRPQQSSQKR